jgi:hypothetical protein
MRHGRFVSWRRGNPLQDRLPAPPSPLPSAHPPPPSRSCASRRRHRLPGGRCRRAVFSRRARAATPSLAATMAALVFKLGAQLRAPHRDLVAKWAGRPLLRQRMARVVPKGSGRDRRQRHGSDTAACRRAPSTPAPRRPRPAGTLFMKTLSKPLADRFKTWVMSHPQHRRTVLRLAEVRAHQGARGSCPMFRPAALLRQEVARSGGWCFALRARASLPSGEQQEGLLAAPNTTTPAAPPPPPAAPAPFRLLTAWRSASHGARRARKARHSSGP